jgi:3-ketosteroid 9alpha-monooxygenase subunit B
MSDVGARVEVDLDGTRHSLRWPRNKSLVDILGPEDLADGLILGCQARPVSDDVHIEY